ncbi:MAG TPA: ABC transporter ATP-binding protein [Azospirillum sp.]|nr:ABC transporter ATP-binding protein [Azospirillum sp.]
MSEAPMLELIDIVRTFEQAGTTLEVLRGVQLAVRPGELVGLVGPSGAGKSTLLHIAGLLERPTSGTVRIGGIDASKLDDGKRTEIRRRAIGFVYQFHHLLPEFTAQENIVLPQMIAGLPRSKAVERARELLRMVGLEQRGSHRPARLSGGEQQRVAIARALANAPGLLIADEPTGNLDPHTAESVFAILMEIVRKARVGALIATHNLELAKRMDRVMEMHEGVLVQHG